MPTQNSSLKVYFGEMVVGEIYEDQFHNLEFKYMSSWLENEKNFSISQSLPLATKTYKAEAQNYFANFLPEGDVRTAVARRFGVSVDNDFRLLEAIGGECAGALTIGQKPVELDNDYEELSHDKIKKIFNDGGVFLAQLQDAEKVVRLSLAGAQDKIPVYFKDGKLFLPIGNSPSSHILKFPSHRFKHMPANECLLNWWANKQGLSVAPTQLLKVQDLDLCLVQRYDRQLENDRLIRLHQEDYCQALNFGYKVKYEKDGGPTFQMCHEITENSSSELPNDLDRLIRWLVFNVMSGNCDAHAKNISLIKLDRNKWSLSPHYDLVCTRIYKEVSTRLAMSIGGSDDSGTITGTHWGTLAVQLKMNKKFMLDFVRDQAERGMASFTQAKTAFIESYGDSPVIQPIEAVANKQIRRLLSELNK